MIDVYLYLYVIMSVMLFVHITYKKVQIVRNSQSSVKQLLVCCFLFASKLKKPVGSVLS